MMALGMLFAVLVLGPLLVLGMLAVASNERAVAWLRRVTGRLHGSTDANEHTPDITQPFMDTAPDTPPDDTANAAYDPTQQTA